MPRRRRNAEPQAKTLRWSVFNESADEAVGNEHAAVSEAGVIFLIPARQRQFGQVTARIAFFYFVRLGFVSSPYSTTSYKRCYTHDPLDVSQHESELPM